MIKNNNKMPVVLQRSLAVVPASFDAATLTLTLVASTGAAVRRQQFNFNEMEYTEYREVLEISTTAIRMGRLQNGAPVLNSHQSNELEDVIGVVTRGYIENNQLMVDVQLSAREEVAGIVQDVANGIIRNVSIGYQVYGASLQMNETDLIPTLLVTDFEPYEVSLVPVGADANAGVRSFEKEVFDVNNFIVRSTGGKPDFKEFKLSDDNKGLPTPEDMAKRDLDVTATATRAERTRVSDLTTIQRQAGFDQPWLDKAIEDNLQVDAARKLALDAVATRAADFDVRNTVDVRGDNKNSALANVLEEAITARAMGTEAVSDDAKQFRFMPLMQMASTFLESNGLSCRGLSPMQIAQNALQKRDGGVSYHTSTDFPSILGNVCGKAMLRGYTEAERTYLPLGNKRNLLNFNQLQLVSLGAAPNLLLVGEHEEYKDGTMGEVAQSARLEKYGRVFSITWESLINDDLQILSRVPLQFGASAARLESDMFYRSLMNTTAINTGLTPASAPLFGAAPTNNQVAGALSLGTLANAHVALSKQVGLSGEVLALMPKYLLVPPEQRLAASQLLGNVIMNNSTQTPVYLGGLQIIVEPRLSMAGYVNSSTTACYLIADPAMVDTIAYGSLDGSDQLHISTREGFRIDGMEVKARKVFYAKAMDFRGMVKLLGV